MTSLPPFLLLVCLIGLVAGADALPEARDLHPMHDVAVVCGNVHVRPLDGGSGLSSGSNSHPKPKDVRLTIRIQAPPAPGERRQIIVEQQVGPNDHNKALLTLLAALAILVVACGAAYAVRRRRGHEGHG